MPYMVRVCCTLPDTPVHFQHILGAQNDWNVHHLAIGRDAFPAFCLGAFEAGENPLGFGDLGQ